MEVTRLPQYNSIRVYTQLQTVVNIDRLKIRNVL
jgi:hypothetical protein